MVGSYFRLSVVMVDGGPDGGRDGQTGRWADGRRELPRPSPISTPAPTAHVEHSSVWGGGFGLFNTAMLNAMVEAVQYAMFNMICSNFSLAKYAMVASE